jgi:nonribosomal peptide synthetase protein VioO
MPHVVEYIDEAGEYIGGPSLALGYRDLPEATAERFVTLNVGSGEQRYFRTGTELPRTPVEALFIKGVSTTK